MISKLADKIVEKLVRSNAIGQDDVELYRYGFFILLSHLLYFCIAVVWGLLLGVVLESVLLYIMFLILRGYAGGFHAESEGRCALYTSVALFLSALSIRLLHTLSMWYVALALLFAGAVIVLLLCPLDTPAKPLSKEERLRYKRTSSIILVGICMVGMGSCAFCMYGITYAATISVLLESVLLLMGKMSLPKSA